MQVKISLYHLNRKSTLDSVLTRKRCLFLKFLGYFNTEFGMELLPIFYGVDSNNSFNIKVIDHSVNTIQLAKQTTSNEKYKTSFFTIIFQISNSF